jgi:IclR family KDG regulon transcriptional repressor
MAYLPKDEIQAITRDEGLPQVCTNTITDPNELVTELSRIRECGYAESLEETDLGAWGVATPIYGRNGEVLAAIGVVGPSSRFSDELARQYVALCHAAARRISALLGTGIESQFGEPS